MGDGEKDTRRVPKKFWQGGKGINAVISLGKILIFVVVFVMAVIK
jgi:hypothetical protein